MSKTIVIGVLVLLVVGGGVFLLLNQTETRSRLGESEYSTTPTQWSQAGDYKITEVPDPNDSTIVRTMVLNEKAGFSFKTPADWKVKGGSFGDIYSLDLISPNAVLRNDVFLENGCMGGVETQSNKDFVVNTNEMIRAISNDPNLYPDKEVIAIDDQVALRTTASDEGEVYSEVTSIEVPLSEEALLVISFTARSASKGFCNKSFDSIVGSFVLE